VQSYQEEIQYKENETQSLLQELEALHEIYTEFYHIVNLQDSDIQKIQQLLEYDNQLIKEGVKNLSDADHYNQKSLRYSRIGIMACIGSLGFFGGITTGCITTIAGTSIGYYI
jgi:hypothetical protein